MLTAGSVSAHATATAGKTLGVDKGRALRPLKVDETRPELVNDALPAKLYLDWHAEQEAEATRLASAVVTAEGTSSPSVSAMFMRGTALPTAAWLRQPLANGSVTSGFGLRRHPIFGDFRQHSGVDFAAPEGSPIVATAEGKVSAAGWQGGYGLLVAVEHKGGLQTRYGHMSALNVTTGQRVRKGQVIGLVGSTGHSTGPHLHYEMRLHGQAVDPLRR